MESVGAVLGLEKQKISEGKVLIKYFCQPCAPTKTNGQRTRNRPLHAPDKWAMFKKYNVRDVETEMGIQQRLAKFPVPDQVWDEYYQDQEINDRGVRLDMELVAAAIEMDTRSRTQLVDTMKGITQLENPNSVKQMKAWLSDNGLQTDTLGYGGSVGALKAMGALDMGLTEEELHPLVDAWRQSNPNIVKFWWDVDYAVMEAVKFKHTTSEYGLTFTCWSGMGFTVVPFGQGFKDMSPPIKELMKLTLEQKLAHGGHPVLRWMMDNIYIRTDPAGNIKADKEKSTEKIDGAVATIMGLDRAIRCGNNTGASVYDDRGILFI